MSVELHRIDDFRQLLEHYEPAQKALDILADIPLVIMLGVTGSGRNTVINHLVNSGRYHFIVSDTTRPPKLRDGVMERDGVQYNFRTEEEVLEDLKNGQYLEAELIHNQQVSGISVRELIRAHDTGKVPINEVEIGGTDAIYRVKPDTTFFFMVPPSYKEWMYRLHGREIMSQEELANRLHTARNILTNALNGDRFFFVVNDSSHATAELIDTFVTTTVRKQGDELARQVARNILEQLQ